MVFHVEKGSLVVEEDTGELHDLVRALTIYDPGCSVILDLAKLGQLDCSGIGRLVQMTRQIIHLGGVFGLVNMVPRHRRLLEALHLLRVLHVFATREEAITACWSAQARSGLPGRRLDPSLLAASPPPGNGHSQADV